METSFIALEASSPEELSAKLAEIPKAEDPTNRFAILAISGPQVLVRPFEFTGVSIKELKNRLQYEAVELLSLPVEEIEFDFQIFISTPEKISGVFVCVPKKLLRDYLGVLDKVKLIPVKVTATILAVIDSFFQQHKIKEERCCLVDFSSQRIINLAVFNSRQCELLREITYENIDEASLEVVRSLRSSCAKSTAKQFERIYFLGDPTNVGKLISEVEGFTTEVLLDNSEGIPRNFNTENNYFNLNLIRNYTVSSGERRRIMAAVHYVMMISLALSLLLAVIIKINSILINNIRASYTVNEYERAKNLEKQLKSL